MNFLTESYLKFPFVYPPEFKRIIDLGLINMQPWELGKEYNTFWDWFREAIDDMIDFSKKNIE